MNFSFKYCNCLWQGELGGMYEHATCTFHSSRPYVLLLLREPLCLGDLGCPQCQHGIYSFLRTVWYPS